MGPVCRAAKLEFCVLCFGYCEGSFLLGDAFGDNMDIDVVQHTAKRNTSIILLNHNPNYFLGYYSFHQFLKVKDNVVYIIQGP